MVWHAVYGIAKASQNLYILANTPKRTHTQCTNGIKCSIGDPCAGVEASSVQCPRFYAIDHKARAFVGSVNACLNESLRSANRMAAMLLYDDKPSLITGSMWLAALRSRAEAAALDACLHPWTSSCFITLPFSMTTTTATVRGSAFAHRFHLRVACLYRVPSSGDICSGSPS